MVTLRRTVRFCINPGGEREGSNGFAGRPSMRGLGRYYELDVICRGEPDPATGYLINIKAIDDAAHAAVIPQIARACAEAPWTDPAELLPALAAGLAERLRPVTLARLGWRLTPTYVLEADMTTAPSPRLLLRQRFDFAAAHRLHVPSLSDAENRAAFGKCNNPSGHGHNYQVEPCVAVPRGASFGLLDLERITGERLVEAFDHKHLNADTREFAAAGGLNPSVENIARVFFDRLAPAVAAEGGELVALTVWETDRTSATVERS